MPVTESKECEVEKARSHYPVVPEATISAEEYKVIACSEHRSRCPEFAAGDASWAAYVVSHFRCSIIAVQILYRFYPSAFIESSVAVPAVILPEKNAVSITGITRPFGITSAAASPEKSAASPAGIVELFGIAPAAALLE